MNQLEQLKQYSKIVADTGDVRLIKQYQTIDATTNPKLILDATENPHYQDIITRIREEAKKNDGFPFPEPIRFIARFITEIGYEILQVIPGRVSSELDPRLSFNTEGTIERARYLIQLYEKKGIQKERILIKVAATYEGIEACRILETEGIHCNMTLVFSSLQALACAKANATLISPFVGRTNEYYENHNIQLPSHNLSPGVQLIHDIVHQFNQQGIKTEVMAASFRDKHQVLAIAGSPLITVPPAILDELIQSEDPVDMMIKPESNRSEPLSVPKSRYEFMNALKNDKAAYHLLQDGVFKFTKAFLKLRQTIFNQSMPRLMLNVLVEKIRQSRYF